MHLPIVSFDLLRQTVFRTLPADFPTQPNTKRHHINEAWKRSRRLSQLLLYLVACQKIYQFKGMYVSFFTQAVAIHGSGRRLTLGINARHRKHIGKTARARSPLMQRPYPISANAAAPTRSPLTQGTSPAAKRRRCSSCP